MIYEEEHLDIREKLQKLPEIKVSDNFVNSLQQKINLVDAELTNPGSNEIIKESFLKKFFINRKYPWLIPASGFAVILLLFFSIYYINTEKKNDFTVSKQTQNKQQPPASEFKSSDEIQKKENLPGKEITSDLESETKKNDVHSRTETSRGYTEQPIQPAPKVSTTIIPAEMEKRVIEQEIKSQIKVEEKSLDYQSEDAVRKETGKIKTEAPTNTKKDEMKKAKDKDDTKGDMNEAKVTETKLGRSMKGSKDSTNADQKALEKMREEIMKNSNK